MAKKVVKKRVKFKRKIRLFLAFVFFGSIASLLSYKFFYNIKQIQGMNDEMDSLNDELVKLDEEKKVLEADIQKLKDPTYIARYAREKYLYSKDGELIIRLPDDEDE